MKISGPIVRFLFKFLSPVSCTYKDRSVSRLFKPEKFNSALNRCTFFFNFIQAFPFSASLVREREMSESRNPSLVRPAVYYWRTDHDKSIANQYLATLVSRARRSFALMTRHREITRINLRFNAKKKNSRRSAASLVEHERDDPND